MRPNLHRVYHHSIMTRKRFLCLAAAALLLSPLYPQKLSRDQVSEIEQAISAEMARQRVPGMSVAVGKKLRLVWSAGLGLADVENSVPARANTVYRLGSISKPITAVAAMQLAESGTLDLDAPIQTYVPSFPEKPWPITARHLLSHLSGIRHYGNIEEVNSTRRYTDLTEPLKIFAADPLLFEPGAQYSYTTYGYCLLGAAVEAAAGVKFVDYIRERIFAPAEMSTARADCVHDLIPHRARGYRKTESGAVENCDLADTSNKIPGGGMVSTPEDLVKFAGAVMKGQLVKPATRDQMFTPAKTRDGKPAPYGLGWQIQEAGGRKWVTHGGAQQGISTLLVMLPEDAFSLALMCNLERVQLFPLAVRITELALR